MNAPKMVSNITPKLFVYLASFVLFLVSSPTLHASGSTAIPTSESSHHCSYEYRVETIPFRHHLIQTEVYSPIDSHRHALILMLTGSQGAFTRSSSIMPRFDNLGERSFAKACYFVVLPHYLQAIGVQSLTHLNEIRQYYPIFLTAVRLALARAIQNPRVLKVGVYGESLGGYLAVELALTDRRVRALSEYGGGLPDDTITRVNCPKALLQHGEEDTTVPLSDAIKLATYLRTAGCSYQFIQYPGEGHMFSPEGQRRLQENSLDFFAATLP